MNFLPKIMIFSILSNRFFTTKSRIIQVTRVLEIFDLTKGRIVLMHWRFVDILTSSGKKRQTYWEIINEGNDESHCVFDHALEENGIKGFITFLSQPTPIRNTSSAIRSEVTELRIRKWKMFLKLDIDSSGCDFATTLSINELSIYNNRWTEYLLV